MDLTVNLAPSYRDLKDPTTRQNFEDTVEQKRVIDLIPCHIMAQDLQIFRNTLGYSPVSTRKVNVLRTGR